ncbi:uncharacterized protein ARB_05165 [Trichophyton benhamiae CBS 112371]|uniref:Uncharacterized protein n=1 Tax=Arthroderma benhamiae (strain ATCC MYA-4681 / CBS 112371) TaxID=663331 RepID=D4ALG8_ARTBC|nr:uncharacterized protein ARB_05165 [Trichophyton benhamiae CBS 112371]EFE36227.1 hypothetical protein ARB_05165 [Trichophyton benhamiae CBS 112371]
MPPAHQTATTTKAAQPKKSMDNLNTLCKQGRHTNVSIKSALEPVSLNRSSKVTATAKFKVFKAKRESVNPRQLEKISRPAASTTTTYQGSQKKQQQAQQQELEAAIPRSPSPGCGALPDCWSCGTELGDCPPCSCEECGMPN